MIDHLGIQCADVDASATFYDTVLAPLGSTRLLEIDGANVIGYGVDTPVFWLGPLSTGEPNRPETNRPETNRPETNREVHIAFAAANRSLVRAFFNAAVAAGAEVLHEPREHPEYHPGYFGAFVRDPDGNNVEAVCHT